MTCLEGHKSKSIDRLCPECVGFDIETLQREIASLEQAVRELLDALESSERAIMEAIFNEDGLDGDAGHKVVTMISKLLKKHKRDSIMQGGKKK